jgi:hypothetical protein
MAFAKQPNNYGQGKKPLNLEEIVDVIESCKMSDFLVKSPLPGAEKHSYFQVTSCHHFVTTNPNFTYIESE